MKVVLSLGRLHPLKGLDLLIEAWAKVVRSLLVHYCDSALVGSTEGSDKITNALMNSRTNELASWQLVIAGPDEQGTLEKLKALSEKLQLKTAETRDLASGAEADVVFLGPVQGEEKWALIKRAELFVLPSRSENFGMVVGEALSCGVPVVTTAVGPWGAGGVRSVAVGSGSGQFEERENIEHSTSNIEHPTGTANCQLPTGNWDRGLIVVETSAEGIAEGLRQMMALSDAERQEMGRQGCEWVRREFSWESVARQMVEAYEHAGMRECSNA